MSGRYHVATFGCQMNKNDSERIGGLLSSLGLKPTDNPQLSDILIINTCSVRQAAEDRVFGYIKNWQSFRRNKPNLIIAVTGCMPGRDREGKIRKRINGVDLWFGIDDLPLLPKRLAELNHELFSSNKIDPVSDYLLVEPKRENKSQAFITIQSGCSNYCTYCVVPYARGKERNRTVKEIVNEARKFAANGGLSVTLLGQTVNHYAAPDREHFSSKNPFAKKDDFAALLWELNQVKGINRIHFTAADPQYFNEYQIEALALPRQTNYIHLPAQSGDNVVLKKMNRHYTREKFIRLIKKIRRACPGIAIGTDLIVGFCGETKKQFISTLDLYKKCDFDIAYSAMYSERSGTVAAKAFEDNVTRVEKKHRWNSLQFLMKKICLKKNQKYVGKTVEVLVEKCEDGVCSGQSREMKLTQFVGRPSFVNKVIRVRIFEAKEWVLKGEMIL